MGCDIHMFAEVKAADAWHLYSDIDVGRDYALFYKIAGVRGYELDTEPIAEGRGLPADLSVAVGIHREGWGKDAHSEGWLSADETVEVLKWCRERYGSPRDWGWKIEWIPEMDYRTVFWFDS